MMMNGKDLLFSPGKERLTEGSQCLGKKINTHAKNHPVKVRNRSEKLTNECEDESGESRVKEEA